MADAEGNGSAPHEVPYPVSRVITRRAVPDRREAAPPATPQDEDRIAAVARDLHSAALAREGVRRISLTVDLVNGRPARARCVSIIRESVEVPLEPLLKR